jgi:hypothetical protein
MKNAVYSDAAGMGIYSMEVTYTPGFNQIAKLKRSGSYAVKGIPSYHKIEDLVYTYNGYRLSSVTENLTIPGKNYGFYDGNTIGNDYLYDAVGNMTYDLNRNISLTYNAADMPPPARRSL